MGLKYLEKMLNKPCVTHVTTYKLYDIAFNTNITISLTLLHPNILYILLSPCANRLVPRVKRRQKLSANEMFILKSVTA